MIHCVTNYSGALMLGDKWTNNGVYYKTIKSDELTYSSDFIIKYILVVTSILLWNAIIEFLV